MGTSGSSKGPSGGVPMVPPWVPDAAPVAPPPDAESPATPDSDAASVQQTPAQSAPVQAQPRPVPIASAARFGGARRSLGSFAASGNSRDMRRGLGHYVRKGYGGGGTAVRRFGGTASTATALHGTLSGIAGGAAGAQDGPLNRALLDGRSSREIMDAIVEAVRPADGTQDSEASRAAIKDALSELLGAYPDADLLELTDAQRDYAIEHFVAIDVFRRIDLDLGKMVREKAPTATVGLARLKEIKNYVKQSVAAAFRRLRDAGARLTKGRVNDTVRAALGETFKVFEGYAQ